MRGPDEIKIQRARKLRANSISMGPTNGTLCADRWLAEHRYRVLRFWNNEVLGNMDGALEIDRSGSAGGRSPSPGSLTRSDLSPQAGRGGACGSLGATFEPKTGLDWAFVVTTVRVRWRRVKIGWESGTGGATYAID